MAARRASSWPTSATRITRRVSPRSTAWISTPSVCRRPPPVACVPPPCGGPPPSLPPVPGRWRRDSDGARRPNRHAPHVSRRAAPAGAALGHGSGAPALDRSLDPAWVSRRRDLPPHGDLRPARVRGRDAHARRRGLASRAAAHPATEDTRLALAAAHRRGRDCATRLPASRARRPERAPTARPVSRRRAAATYAIGSCFSVAAPRPAFSSRRRSPRPSRLGRSEAACPFRSRGPIACGTRTRCTSCGAACRSRRSGTSWAGMSRTLLVLS